MCSHACRLEISHVCLSEAVFSRTIPYANYDTRPSTVARVMSAWRLYTRSIICTLYESTCSEKYVDIGYSQSKVIQ